MTYGAGRFVTVAWSGGFAYSGFSDDGETWKGGIYHRYKTRVGEILYTEMEYILRPMLLPNMATLQMVKIGLLNSFLSYCRLLGNIIYGRRLLMVMADLHLYLIHPHMFYIL